MKLFKISFLAAALFFVITLSGCKENSTDPVQQNNVSLSFAVDNSTPLAKSSLDTLTIDTAKVLISYIQFKKNSSDSTGNSKTGPFVLHFNLSGNVTTILYANIPDGTYERAKFRVHKPDVNDVLPDPEFQGGQQGSERYTLIVKGSYLGTPFVYRGTKSSTQEIFLQSSVPVVSGTEVNITVTCGIKGWFKKDGAFIDPSNSVNFSTIEDNIKTSFLKGFKDKNRDGIPD